MQFLSLTQQNLAVSGLICLMLLYLESMFSYWFFLCFRYIKLMLYFVSFLGILLYHYLWLHIGLVMFYIYKNYAIFRCFFGYIIVSLFMVCKIVNFETTPIMSAYLTAIAIGDCNYISGDMNNINQRIYFPLQNPKRALDMSLKVLTYYEKLLKIKWNSIV